MPMSSDRPRGCNSDHNWTAQTELPDLVVNLTTTQLTKFILTINRGEASCKQTKQTQYRLVT